MQVSYIMLFIAVGPFSVKGYGGSARTYSQLGLGSSLVAVIELAMGMIMTPSPANKTRIGLNEALVLLSESGYELGLWSGLGWGGTSHDFTFDHL